MVGPGGALDIIPEGTTRLYGSGAADAVVIPVGEDGGGVPGAVAGDSADAGSLIGATLPPSAAGYVPSAAAGGGATAAAAAAAGGGGHRAGHTSRGVAGGGEAAARVTDAGGGGAAGGPAAIRIPISTSSRRLADGATRDLAPLPPPGADRVEESAPGSLSGLAASGGGSSEAASADAALKTAVQRQVDLGIVNVHHEAGTPLARWDGSVDSDEEGGGVAGGVAAGMTKRAASLARRAAAAPLFSSPAVVRPPPHTTGATKA